MPQYSGVWSLQQQMQALTSGQWATDPLFDYTTLLLQGDAGANGAQNNVFYDTSPNQFAITRNGNTTQGTFSPFSATGWGNYFNGSTDYFTVADNAAFDFAAGDFTVEGWVYRTGGGDKTTNAFFNQSTIGGSSNTAFGMFAGNNGCSLYLSTSGTAWTNFIETGVAPTANSWSHIVFQRRSNTLEIYLNGTLQTVTAGSSAFSGTIFNSSRNIEIGFQTANGSSYFNGSISNLRVVKGTALYTSNFTPSSIPLTAVTGTSLLTCQSNRFVDNSSNAFAVTVNGTPSVQAFSPFAPQFQYTASGTGGSGYFDGSGDYLTTNNINLAANAFTIEGWFYVTTTAGNMNYWGMTNGGGTNPKCLLYMDNAGNLVFETGSISGAVISVSISTYVRRNAWQHIAISRSGTGAGQTAMFIDGVRAGTGTCASLATVTAGFNIGYIGEGFGVNYNGYIANFRVVNGTAVYNPASTTVTIPTAPLTAVTNTALLTNFTNAGILDGTMKNNLETVGNAQVSTSVVKYGSGSMYFDGSGDWLVARDNAYLNLGSSDFTIEFWMYVIANPAAAAGILCKSVYASNAGWTIIYYPGYIAFLPNASGPIAVQSAASSISTGVWTHVAITRQGTVGKAFINGIQSGSSGTISNFTDSSNVLGVGALDTTLGWNGAYPFNGYLDDLRITKGIARYTQNFIPPSVALPRQ